MWRGAWRESHGPEFQLLYILIAVFLFNLLAVQLSGDLTGVDVAALLRRLGGATGTDAVTRVPITADGDGAAHNGSGNG